MRRTPIRAIAVAFAISTCPALGCGGGSKPGKAGTKADAKADKKADAKADKKTPPNKPTPPPVAKKPVSELFAKGAVGMPAPLQGVAFGDPEAKVKETVPALADGTAFRPEAFDGVAVRVQYYKRSKTLRLVQVELPGDDARATIESLWGAPLPRAPESGEGQCWINAEGATQATLGADGKLMLGPMMPWATIVGGAPATTAPADAKAEKPAKKSKKDAAGKGGGGGALALRLGFESEPLLGMSAADVKTKYEAYVRDSAVVSDERVVLNLPPYECRQSPTFVDLKIEGGVVTRVNLKLVYGKDEAMRGAVEQALKARFGEPLATKDNVSTYRRAEPKIVVSQDPAAGHFSLFFSAPASAPAKAPKPAKPGGA